MPKYQIGQRWYSETEPELGLGIIIKIEPGQLVINYRQSKTERMYKPTSAPLKRAIFEINDPLKTENGYAFVILDRKEKEGLIYYSDGKEFICETQISDAASVTSPRQLLLAHTYDTNEDFNLRLAAHHLRHKINRSPVKGLVGGRITLFPHQIDVVHQAVKRAIPRLLLADDVGLGKTIEASLIIHYLLQTRQISRVLIIVPEALVFQWYAEFIHRFHLIFALMDEEYCLAVDASVSNPFLNEERGIISFQQIQKKNKRTEQLVAAGWDMIVIDEAHHLEEDSYAYQLVSQLCQSTPQLLLLTATPEQLGEEGHFARLKLLDANRFTDYGKFLKEAADFHKISQLASKIMDNKTLTNKDYDLLSKLNLLDFWKEKKEQAALVDMLLDLYGIGRVMFRNTRNNIKNFPVRQITIHHLPDKENQWKSIIDQESFSDWFGQEKRKLHPFQTDPRLTWLIDFIQSTKEKILLICSTTEKVKKIMEIFQRSAYIRAAAFHEEIPFLQRDKNAAWFKSPQGAQVLVSSEIGSEGRNFQFVNHLIFFDLPFNPELVEQRIGRLDRIGQKRQIQIIILTLQNSAAQHLAQWYDQGMGIFHKNISGARQLFKFYQQKLIKILTDSETPLTEQQAQLKELIEQTAVKSKEIQKQLQEGRDRLLELQSHRPERSQKIIQEIDTIDKEVDLEFFLLKVFHHVGIQSRNIDHRTYHLYPGILKTDAFPRIEKEGLTITFDRQIANDREDFAFLTIDHPLTERSIDLISGQPKGSASCALWLDKQLDESILLEMIFILECICDQKLFISRFLPPTPIRLVLDHQFRHYSQEFSLEYFSKVLKNDQNCVLLRHDHFINQLFPEMLAQGQQAAENQSKAIIQQAQTNLTEYYEFEIKRLQKLKEKNSYIDQTEIDLLTNKKEQSQSAFSQTRLRLDALRLIYRKNIS
ncbi:MAG: RNA polymerase-associated protein RapA [Spirochaetes bacterium]|nr:RNA polymerase-associated protein RapA [Spirochaetota bacterium]